jgi:hypothetical protein
LGDGAGNKGKKEREHKKRKEELEKKTERW